MFDDIGQEVPLIVPTLDSAEITAVVNGEDIPNSVYEKAAQWAQGRLEEGKSVWAEEGEMKDFIQKRTGYSDEQLQKYISDSGLSEYQALISLMKQNLSGK
jgi:hypothetical protein